jgi:hypothetical protein
MPANSRFDGKRTGNLSEAACDAADRTQEPHFDQGLFGKFPSERNREFFRPNREAGPIIAKLTNHCVSDTLFGKAGAPASAVQESDR